MPFVTLGSDPRQVRFFQRTRAFRLFRPARHSGQSVDPGLTPRSNEPARHCHRLTASNKLVSILSATLLAVARHVPPLGTARLTGSGEGDRKRHWWQWSTS